MTGETLAEAPNASPEDVDRAVAAARAAQPKWAALSAWDRAKVCHAIADLIDERREEFARELSLEQGKPYTAEALPDIDETAENFRIAAETVAKMDRHLEDAVGKGASVVLGGSRAGDRPTQLYYEPTVVTDVGVVDTLINRQETFEPIVPLIRVRSDDEALAAANDSHLGLQAAVYTFSLKGAFRYLDNLRVGNVVVNDSTDYWRRTRRSAERPAPRRAGAGSAAATRCST